MRCSRLVLRGCRSHYELAILTVLLDLQAEHLFPIPSNLSLATATGLLSSGMTAYKALVEVGNVKIGTRLFINGGTTACGMAAIQIAKILGAGHIVVSCSSPSFELVKEMGADEVRPTSHYPPQLWVRWD